MKVLLKFNHGLGDCVQFTSVLKHLKRLRPDWRITFKTQRGKHSVGLGLCERTTFDDEIDNKEQFDLIKHVSWNENFYSYSKYPSTKIERCLLEEFQIEPQLDLCSYSQEVGDEAFIAAKSFLLAIGAEQLHNGRYNVVCLHYQGNTSTTKKNINHDNALIICNEIRKYGLIPIILDWDSRSPLPDNKKIFCPDKNHPLWGGIGTGDSERIAALILRSQFFIGIDSGPGHCAGTTPIPTLIIWSKHHPINYYEPMNNVLHLVPHNVDSFVHSGGNGSVQFFRENYSYHIYTNLAKSLIEHVRIMVEKTGTPVQEKINSPLIKSGDFWIREDNAEQDMVIVWDICFNDAYKLSVIPGIIEQAKFVVDVGAHIGTFAKKIHELNPNCKIACIEVCPENIECLKANVGEFAQIFQAACTYEKEDMMLLNAVRPNCESTGGSTVIPATAENSFDRQPTYQYWSDRRPILKLTLEQILQMCGEERIDILKLDCEGSEISILRNTPSLDKIRFILGEYHVKKDWEQLREKRFKSPQWDYGIMFQNTQMGNFHLSNMNWK